MPVILVDDYTYHVTLAAPVRTPEEDARLTASLEAGYKRNPMNFVCSGMSTGIKRTPPDGKYNNNLPISHYPGEDGPIFSAEEAAEIVRRFKGLYDLDNN